MKNRPLTLANSSIYDVRTHASGPMGLLPLQPDFLRESPSGNVFGWTQDAAIVLRKANSIFHKVFS